ncbi:hypothetical protein DSECCO2_519700 [anaerobic digester metagenome]
MAEMVGHFGIEGSFDEGLGQLLEKAFLADEVFRLLVIRQEGVDQVDWKWLACGHVVSLWGRLSTTDRLHKIFYTPQEGTQGRISCPIRPASPHQGSRPLLPFIGGHRLC